MFFRREKAREWSFDDRLANLKQFGFETVKESGNKARATRRGCGAILEDLGGGNVGISKVGILIKDEIGMLVHGGYQMFLVTPSGKEHPALAEQLQALHNFDEDLREGLGLTSLYNLSLGTRCDDHLYDRVEDRDAPKHPHPWAKKAAVHS
jgi:hypothetical protein